MKFSYTWLKDIVGFKKSPRELADFLNRYAFDTELSGENLEIKLPPNRVGDASGHLGVARELGFLLKKNLRPLKIAYKKSSFKTEEFLKVDVRKKSLCQRYTALYARLSKPGRTPFWMGKRLEDCGLRPISPVVDIMNYVMLELGQPMHAFDYGKLATSDKRQATKAQEKKKIIVRLAEAKEKMTTLDGKRLVFSGSELLIADEKRVLALAGIKGGQFAEIDAGTKEIVVEAANFEAKNIRESSHSTGVKTDASTRFENFLDPNLTQTAIQRAAVLLQEICGAEMASSFVDVYPKKSLPKKITISLEEIEKIIGFPVKPNEAIQVFKTLTTKIKKLKKGAFVLELDSLRQDLKIKQDVAEEVLRYLGYHKIPAKTVAENIQAPETEKEIELKWRIQDELVKLGFDEVMNYSLLRESDIEILRRELGGKKDYLEIEKPTSENYRYLRRSLASGILRNVSENAKNFSRIKIFETGHVFSKQKNSLPDETISLGLAVFGHGRAQEQFLELKGSLVRVFESLGLGEVVFKNPEVYELGGKRLPFGFKGSRKNFGHAVNLPGSLLEWYGIKGPVSYAQVNLNELLKKQSLAKTFRGINRLPVLKRDISFFIDKNIEYSKVAGKIKSQLIESFELFDVFEKSGKKSFSFHLIFRVKDRTLTDKEVDVEMQKITQKLEDIGAKIR
ncbi:MAG: Phenylalanine-tRNA ligase beta subunit [Parcubacteria group bacterium GW2011_GWC1_45_9]|nr:MAG: Phenylalanine-tRNA ligase beta subunit [Parcubacteria group bacterium GW2011_GWB1_45_10]KKU17372.1 MAG: Phenylalanine-tRNA ligase beta subunit [Parcubacteria group bacterium GW2011_GWC1_45_9]